MAASDKSPLFYNQQTKSKCLRWLRTFHPRYQSTESSQSNKPNKLGPDKSTTAITAVLCSYFTG